MARPRTAMGGGAANSFHAFKEGPQKILHIQGGV